MGVINGIIIYKLGRRRGRKKAEKRIARGASQCPDFVDNSEYQYGETQGLVQIEQKINFFVPTGPSCGFGRQRR